MSNSTIEYHVKWAFYTFGHLNRRKFGDLSVSKATLPRTFSMSEGVNVQRCKSPGDMTKAFGAGADFVMIGGEFSEHDENQGEIYIDSATNEKYKLFYGMSSKHAMEKYYGKMNNYRASEGTVIKMKYKGGIRKYSK